MYTFSLVHTHCPTYANPLIHAHYFFILIDTFVQFHLCLFLFHPHASLYLHWLLMHTFGLMLTQCSLRTCLPLVVVIFLNASLTHFCFMHSYYSMHPLCLYPHLLFIHAFALLILSTWLRLLVLSIFCSLLILFRFPVHLHMTILSHLISCASWSNNYSFAHLPTYHFLLPFLPCYFPGFSFIRFPFFSPFQCSTLLPSSPTLHHHLPLLHSLLLSPPSFTHLSTSFLTLFPYFPPPSFPFSFLSLSFYIFGATYVWPFSVILWLIF